MRALGRGLGRTAQQAPAELPACVSCRATGQPLESRAVEGVELLICVEYQPCIQRAKATGTWKR